MPPQTAPLRPIGREPAFDVLRLVAMFFVMLIHSTPTDDRWDLHFFKWFIGSGAVPAFFLVSGYFAARKIDQPQYNFALYAKDKAQTLIVPYVFWNLLILELVLLVKSVIDPELLRGGGGAYFSFEPTISSAATAIFGLGRPPIVYQFWFLRDLIVVSLIAFPICRTFRAAPLFGWMLFFVPLPIFSSMAYFLLGYSLSRISFSPQSIKRTILMTHLISWSLLGLAVSMKSITIPYPAAELGSAFYLLSIAVLLSRTSLSSQIARAGAASFFVYAVHEPAQTVILRIWQATETPGYGGWATFIGVPVGVLLISLFAYSGIRRFFPGALGIMTGSR